MKILFTFFCLFISLNVFNQTSNADSLKSWMNWLAADERKGRANGSVENVEVADWLVTQFKASGAIPVPGHDDMFEDYISSIGKSLTNIIGYIPGKSDSNLIILSAHYDHVGTDPENKTDPVFNGADDNASGICMLLGIAQQIRQDSIKPECSIILAAFSGEEIGLQGSANFCKSDFIPWDKVRLDLNFEMCGRSDEQGRNNFYITGPSYSTLANQIMKYNHDKSWRLKDIGPFANMLYKMSDNYSFVAYRNGRKQCLPAHTIATSIGESYVHQSYDEVKFIDFENMQSFIVYSKGLVYNLAENFNQLGCIK
jgi:Zn-dependent M28 family amino/carboxypeptidase